MTASSFRATSASADTVSISVETGETLWRYDQRAAVLSLLETRA